MESIDIIMPVYNCEKYIKYAIESVKNQTNSNWKLIIIDDASTDNTKQLIEKNIKEIRDKVVIINSKKHIGVANSRNLGIEKSKSRYIAFLDADDIWKEEKLKKQIKFMKKNKYAFTYTLYTYLKNKEKQVKYFPQNLNYEKALRNTFILTSTVIIDTQQISKKHIKMPNIESEDTAAWWNILKKGYTAYGLKENLTIYRIRKEGLSFNKIKNLKKTWKLYRIQEKLSIITSISCFCSYIFNATKKRII